ncbi:nascent polypeptide-associated complex subunit alpha, muscle-specific form-like [Carassius auratus]|uniref:Nascent polypeptide-associated complex subunit alpha, muscle-specific form-like n=1 Tax=Carassius auratus TaxID=7957 RepID=A0A6P6NIN2_CARAU|nr:nascent polypeptide-associated complex subunit alpha, muscle-specific form-like [Carassius auratus]
MSDYSPQGAPMLRLFTLGLSIPSLHDKKGRSKPSCLFQERREYKPQASLRQKAPKPVKPPQKSPVIECSPQEAPLSECFSGAPVVSTGSLQGVYMPAKTPQREPLLESFTEGGQVFKCSPEGSPVSGCSQEGAPKPMCSPQAAPVIECSPQGAPMLRLFTLGLSIPTLHDQKGRSKPSCLFQERREYKPQASLRQKATKPVKSPQRSPVPECSTQGTPVSTGSLQGAHMPADTPQGESMLANVSKVRPLPKCSPEGSYIPKCSTQEAHLSKCSPQREYVHTGSIQGEMVLKCPLQELPVLECSPQGEPVFEFTQAELFSPEGSTQGVSYNHGTPMPKVFTLGKSVPFLSTENSKLRKYQAFLRQGKRLSVKSPQGTPLLESYSEVGPVFELPPVVALTPEGSPQGASSNHTTPMPKLLTLGISVPVLSTKKYWLHKYQSFLRQRTHLSIKSAQKSPEPEFSPQGAPVNGYFQKEAPLSECFSGTPVLEYFTQGMLGSTESLQGVNMPAKDPQGAPLLESYSEGGTVFELPPVEALTPEGFPQGGSSNHTTPMPKLFTLGISVPVLSTKNYRLHKCQSFLRQRTHLSINSAQKSPEPVFSSQGAPVTEYIPKEAPLSECFAGTPRLEYSTQGMLGFTGSLQGLYMPAKDQQGAPLLESYSDGGPVFELPPAEAFTPKGSHQEASSNHTTTMPKLFTLGISVPVLSTKKYRLHKYQAFLRKRTYLSIKTAQKSPESEFSSQGAPVTECFQQEAPIPECYPEEEPMIVCSPEEESMNVCSPEEEPMLVCSSEEEPMLVCFSEKASESEFSPQEALMLESSPHQKPLPYGFHFMPKLFTLALSSLISSTWKHQQHKSQSSMKQRTRLPARSSKKSPTPKSSSPDAAMPECPPEEGSMTHLDKAKVEARERHRSPYNQTRKSQRVTQPAKGKKEATMPVCSPEEEEPMLVYSSEEEPMLVCLSEKAPKPEFSPQEALMPESSSQGASSPHQTPSLSGFPDEAPMPELLNPGISSPVSSIRKHQQHKSQSSLKQRTRLPDRSSQKSPAPKSSSQDAAMPEGSPEEGSMTHLDKAKVEATERHRSSHNQTRKSQGVTQSAKGKKEAPMPVCSPEDEAPMPVCSPEDEEPMPVCSPEEEQPMPVCSPEEEEPMLVCSSEEEPMLVCSSEEELMLVCSSEEEPMLVCSSEEEPMLVCSSEEEPMHVCLSEKAPKPELSPQEALMPESSSQGASSPTLSGFPDEAPMLELLNPGISSPVCSTRKHQQHKSQASLKQKTLLPVKSSQKSPVPESFSQEAAMPECSSQESSMHTGTPQSPSLLKAHLDKTRVEEPHRSSSNKARMSHGVSQPAKTLKKAPMPECSPEEEPISVCSPEEEPMLMFSPEEEPMLMCSPEDEPLHVCSPEEEPMLLCLSEIVPEPEISPLGAPILSFQQDNKCAPRKKQHTIKDAKVQQKPQRRRKKKNQRQQARPCPSSHPNLKRKCACSRKKLDNLDGCQLPKRKKTNNRGQRFFHLRACQCCRFYLRSQQRRKRNSCAHQLPRRSHCNLYPKACPCSQPSFWRQQNPHTHQREPVHLRQRTRRPPPRAYSWLQSTLWNPYDPQVRQSDLGRRAQRISPRAHTWFQPSLWRQQNVYSSQSQPWHMGHMRLHPRTYPWAHPHFRRQESPRAHQSRPLHLGQREMRVHPRMHPWTHPHLWRAQNAYEPRSRPWHLGQRALRFHPRAYSWFWPN